MVSVVTILTSGSQRLAHTLEADDQTLICAVRVNRLCGGERSKFSVTFDSRLVYTAGCKLYCTSPVKFLAFIKSCSPTSVCVCVCECLPLGRVFFFLNCIVPLGFLSREIRVAFSGESQLRQSRATQSIVHAGCFSVSIIHQVYRACWVF